MKMEFFGRCRDISSMRVFYATIVGLVVGLLFHQSTEYYWFGNKTCYGYRAKIKYRSRNVVLVLASRNDFYFSNRFIICSNMDFICTCRFYGVASGLGYDGYNRTVAIDASDRLLTMRGIAEKVITKRCVQELIF
jgi:hypothetical protein